VIRRAIRALPGALLLLPAAVRGQDVVIRNAGPGRGADIVRRVVAGPHVLRAGSDRLDLPRDTTITSSLVVIGRPTYLASRVQGDVVVVGADLFLRPGVEVTGRAVAIGGTVSESTLGHVAGGVESLRDESYVAELRGDQYLLDYRSLRTEISDPLFQLAGFRGVKMPSYNRVDGLSLPVGVMLQFGNHALEIEPYATYRSRLGVVDGAVELRTRQSARYRLEGRVARDTRSNERWIYRDLLNSAVALFSGTDARNYFRADLGEARAILHVERGLFTMEPYLGGRFERVRPITAVGNVWSLFGRTDSLRMARPNPLVDRGDIGSALGGVELRTLGLVTSRVQVDLEAGLDVDTRHPLTGAPSGASKFTQVTVNGTVELPSFRTHTLRVDAHAVATAGDAPGARYAYLGGSGTLKTLDLLEMGGTSLFFLESRYLIPLEFVHLPVVGSPILTLRDAFGAAGVDDLPDFQHEVGIGIGMSVLRIEYTRAVAGKSGSEFGFGVSLSRF
jgi:hypothetical protein